MLSAQRVEEIFVSCLFEDGKKKIRGKHGNYVRAEGIMRRKVYFSSDRIEQNRREIEEMILELSPDFMKSKGGGMSFLRADHDKNGVQWTGFHLRVEELFLLGLAIGKVKLLMPREMWHVLPGGMPYYVVIGE